jgi:LysM repeat protein
VVSTIGLKIANGEFFSIVEENSLAKKRLILTTVHDKQLSAQIDLYKSYTSTMADAFYIGSLVVDNIKSQPKGEPSIELIIASSKNGNITAEAMDLDSSAKGDRQTLSVSLRSLDEDNLDMEIPDFELDNDEIAPESVYDDDDEEEEYSKKRKFPWLIVVCAALILTAIGLVIWILFFQNSVDLVNRANRSQQLAQVQQNPSPPVQAAPVQPQPVRTQPASLQTVQAQQAAQVQQNPSPPPPLQSAPAQPAAPPPVAQAPVQPPAPPPVVQAPAQPAAPPPVIQAPVQAPPASASVARERTAPPVASYNVPSVIPREGVPYRIRQGDTLWDISEAFYRDPWLYPRIARFNNIPNPDLIIAGTTIRVPPRN